MTASAPINKPFTVSEYIHTDLPAGAYEPKNATPDIK
jgi:hypothetical protein